MALYSSQHWAVNSSSRRKSAVQPLTCYLEWVLNFGFLPDTTRTCHLSADRFFFRGVAPGDIKAEATSHVDIC